jgi:hypothetical protein
VDSSGSVKVASLDHHSPTLLPLPSPSSAPPVDDRRRLPRDGATLPGHPPTTPSTRQVDLHLKRARYEAAGCPSYWVVDPEAPSIVVLEIEKGRYVERAHAVGSDEIDVALPYRLTLTPRDLVV